MENAAKITKPITTIRGISNRLMAVIYLKKVPNSLFPSEKKSFDEKRDDGSLTARAMMPEDAPKRKIAMIETMIR